MRVCVWENTSKPPTNHRCLMAGERMNALSRFYSRWGMKKEPRRCYQRAAINHTIIKLCFLVSPTHRNLLMARPALTAGPISPPATASVNLCQHCHSNKNQAIIVVTPRRTAGINCSLHCNGDTIDCCGGAVKFNTEMSVLHCQPPPTGWYTSVVEQEALGRPCPPL